MKSIIAVLVLIGFVSFCAAACEVTLTPVQRTGTTWPVNNGAGIAGIYDITAYNSGTQNARRVYFDILLPSDAYIIQWWQFSRLPPTYEDLPDNFTPGSSYGSAGFVIERPNSNVFPSVSLVYNYTVCY